MEFDVSTRRYKQSSIFEEPFCLKRRNKMARYHGVIKFRGKKYRIFAHFYTKAEAVRKQDQLHRAGKQAIIKKHVEKSGTVLWLVYDRDVR